jgi:hypothetical protein
MFVLIEGLGSSENRWISVLSGDYAELASRVKKRRFLEAFVCKLTDRISLLTAVSCRSTTGTESAVGSFTVPSGQSKDLSISERSGIAPVIAFVAIAAFR